MGHRFITWSVSDTMEAFPGKKTQCVHIAQTRTISARDMIL